jgi:hypothetical protein
VLSALLDKPAVAPGASQPFLPVLENHNYSASTRKAATVEMASVILPDRPLLLATNASPMMKPEAVN